MAGRRPVGQPRATTHPLDLHRAEPGPGAPGWKGPRFPPASPHIGPAGRPAPALGSPQLGGRLLCPRAVALFRAFPHGPPAPGDRDPQALERGGSSSGCRMEAGARPPPLPCPPARTHRSVFWEDAFLRAVTGPYGLVLTPGSD
ncbi:uncharacterized protein WM294_013801 [Sarcoramphus papa]